MSQITVTLPDGSSREFDRGTTPAEIAAAIGSRLAKAAIAAKIDGEWADLNRPIDADAAVLQQALKAGLRIATNDPRFAAEAGLPLVEV